MTFVGEKRLTFWDFLWMGREQWPTYPHPLARTFVHWLGPLGVHARIRNTHVLRVIEELPLPSGARVLDAGCGRAYASFWLARRHTDWEIWGIDVDAGVVEHNQEVASALGLGNLHFRKGDAAEVEAFIPFDLVFSIDVLEHLENDVGALVSWRQVMNRAGWLVLHLPLRHQMQRRVFRAFKQHVIADHVRDEYTKEEIEAKLARAGFTLHSITYGFGIWGELAFELNYLFWQWPGLRTSFALLTFPLAIFLGYADSRSSLSRGNSLILLARPSEA